MANEVFSSLVEGLLDITPERKKIVSHFFTPKAGSFSFIFCNIAIFFKISVFLFDLFTNKARKLKVAVSNQAKASLTKP